MAKKRPKKGKAKSKDTTRAKPGKRPLSPTEPTERATVNLPASLYEDLVRRAAQKSVSAYLRELVENDLRKAG